LLHLLISNSCFSSGNNRAADLRGHDTLHGPWQTVIALLTAH